MYLQRFLPIRKKKLSRRKWKKQKISRVLTDKWDANVRQIRNGDLGYFWNTTLFTFVEKLAALLRIVFKVCTVWKFHYFCIIQILREINFEDIRSAKSAILPYLEALNFDLYEFLHFLKAENEQNSQPLKWQKRQILHF